MGHIMLFLFTNQSPRATKDAPTMSLSDNLSPRRTMAVTVAIKWVKIHEDAHLGCREDMQGVVPKYVGYA